MWTSLGPIILPTTVWSVVCSQHMGAAMARRRERQQKQGEGPKEIDCLSIENSFLSEFK